MEKNNNEFSGLINMIKVATNDGESKGIAVREYGNKIVYGEIDGGFIEKPVELNVVDKGSLCQKLYDNLNSEFGEQLHPGYSHSFSGEYEYFMTLDNLFIFFPNGYEYQNWIYNQVQKDNEKNREEKSKGKK